MKTSRQIYRSIIKLGIDILTSLLRLLQITSSWHDNFNIKERMCGFNCWVGKRKQNKSFGRCVQKRVSKRERDCAWKNGFFFHWFVHLKVRVVDCKGTTLRLRFFIVKEEVRICVCFWLVGFWIGRDGWGFVLGGNQVCGGYWREKEASLRCVAIRVSVEEWNFESGMYFGSFCTGLFVWLFCFWFDFCCVAL